MDRIEQLMKTAKPRLPQPGTVPGALPDRSEVFSADPNVVTLAQHKPRRTAVRAAAGVFLAAAAVVGAVVVSSNLVPQSAPAPATTSTVSASPTPTPTTTPTATASPSTAASPTPTSTTTQPAAPTATTSPSAPASPPPVSTPVPRSTIAAGSGPAAGACTVANIDVRRYEQVSTTKPIPADQQQFYTVLGCTEGWIAYSVSDDGIRASGADGGNVYFSLARLQGNGRYLTDFAQVWTSVHSWEFLSYSVQNGQYATVQQGMDDEFASKGIPVRLRTQLVGTGPAAPPAASTPKP